MKFLNSGKAFSKVQALRDQITDCLAELKSLETDPLPADEAKARVRRWLEANQADQGIALHLVGWATSPDQNAIGPRGLEGWEVGGDRPPVDLLRELMRILAVVAPDQIEAAAGAEIDRRLANKEPGLPMADRPKRRAELEQQLSELEVQEEAAIEKLEEAGHLVHRRAEARPEIILGETQ